MNFRKRIVTLLATGIIAVSIAPLSAQARAANPQVMTAPFSPHTSEWCLTEGTGLCTSDATALSNGAVTGTSTSYVREHEAAGVTGTSLAYSSGRTSFSLSVPKGGASSVSFTVDAHINSANASRSNPLQNAYADVSFFAYARASSGQCTSCTVFFRHTVADTIVGNDVPASRSDEDESFTFVLRSAAGDRLKGKVDLQISFFEWTWIGRTGPLPIEGTAEARGDAVLKTITAKFNG